MEMKQKQQKTVRWVIGVALIITALLLLSWAVKELRIDDCLDGGGSWNYDLGQCEY